MVYSGTTHINYSALHMNAIWWHVNSVSNWIYERSEVRELTVNYLTGLKKILQLQLARGSYVLV